jgi:pimeloyl-ACP methyl ester carboxylesterase
MIGYGYTDPRGPENYSGKAQGEFLINFIDALDVGAVFLAGHSHGGFLVQYAAHERPDLVSKLIIIDSLNGSTPIPSIPEGWSYIYGPKGHLYEKPTLESTRQNLEYYYAHRDLVTDARVKKAYDTILRNYEYANNRAKAVSYSVEAANKNLSYKGKHISEWASELKMPVLITWSENGGNRIEWALNLFKKIPGCELHVFPWAGHSLQIDQKDRWAHVVIDWLKSDPPNPPN